MPFVEFPGANYQQDYVALEAYLEESPIARQLEIIRENSLKDLFFLLYFPLRINVNHPWLVDRITEVQNENDRTLDLWPREYFKSTIITYGLNIQELLRDPELRIGIFSHTRNIAKTFLRRIKHTFETNQVLQMAFPEALWADPKLEAPKWSEDEGLHLKRQGVYTQASLEAWGLVDSMPTGAHFDILHYDDVVTIDSVTTPEQLAKVEERFQLSLNLGAGDLVAGLEGKRRIVGTIYHFNDLHRKLIKVGSWNVRTHPAIDENGEAVFLDMEKLNQKRKDMGPYIFASQMLLNPISDDQRRFNIDWLQYYDKLPKVLTLFALVDPATSKKIKASGSDYTVIWVWGLDERGNRFLVDMVRDRFNLTERWEALKHTLRKWPKILRVGYEKYGMQADIEYFREKMSEESFFFPIVELGGPLSKTERILRMVPYFEQGKVWLPYKLLYKGRDLIQEFINEEYLFFPLAPHDDMLDAASRIEDKEFHTYLPYVGYDPEEDGDRELGYVSLGWAEGKRESRFARL